MKLTAIILSSDSKEKLIGGAIDSCIDFVDLFLLVHMLDSAANPDKTLEVARDHAGKKLLIQDVPLGTGVSGARNIGLSVATALDSQWAMQLDTDERFNTNGVDIRMKLSMLPHHYGQISVRDTTGVYPKLRFFRLPARGHFTKDVHESFVSTAETYHLTKAKFYEIPKSAEEMLDRYLKQEIELRKQIEEDPKNARWHYYLGSALEKLGRWMDAVKEYSLCMALAQTPDSSAWACFRVACCFVEAKDYTAAIYACKEGVKMWPHFVELHWALAMSHLLYENYEVAITVAMEAACRVAVIPNLEKHFGTEFHNPVAYFEGPYEIIAQAARELDDCTRESLAVTELHCQRELRKKMFG